MRLRSIDFPVVCPDRSAAFQQLISNDIRNFAPRQLTDELDYGKCKTLCSRFKFFFQSIRFQFAIRNSPSAIRHPQFAIRNSMPSTLLQFAIRNSPSAIQCFRPSSIRNSQSAIGNSNNIREGLLRLAEIPDAQEEKEGDNRH
jgi:hypothetical protein